MHALELLVESIDGPVRSLPVSAPLVVVAGFTGRNPAAVQEHIKELGVIGVPEPAEVPALYTVPNWTLVQARDHIQVATDRGSGEAEPVLVAMPDGGLYVTVGSDHTDRDLEQTSIELAKLAHPKVLGRTAWPLEDVQGDWDELVLRSWVGQDTEPYQEDRLKALVPPLELLEHIHARLRPQHERPLVAFLGTVPLLQGSFRFDNSFTAAIEDGSRDRRLLCSYTVEPIGTLPLAEAR